MNNTEKGLINTNQIIIYQAKHALNQSVHSQSNMEQPLANTYHDKPCTAQAPIAELTTTKT